MVANWVVCLAVLKAQRKATGKVLEMASETGLGTVPEMEQEMGAETGLEKGLEMGPEMGLELGLEKGLEMGLEKVLWMALEIVPKLDLWCPRVCVSVLSCEFSVSIRAL